MAAGSVVWLVLGIATVAWAAVLVFARGALFGARRVARWLLSAWVPRAFMLTAWSIAGWHVFCQRP